MAVAVLYEYEPAQQPEADKGAEGAQRSRGDRGSGPRRGDQATAVPNGPHEEEGGEAVPGNRQAEESVPGVGCDLGATGPPGAEGAAVKEALQQNAA